MNARVAAVVARLATAGVLLATLSVAARAPEIPLLLKLVSGGLLLTTLLEPVAGLLATAALIPAGLLLAPAPASASEALAWSFLAGWLIAIWRPLSETPAPMFAGRTVALYAGAVAVSWLGLIVADAGGIPFAHLPGFLVRAVSPDYLVFSSPESETWSALHALTGLALLASTRELARREPRVRGWLAATLVGASALLGVATLGGVWREWASHGYGGWFLWRYVTGVRYSLHLTDLNAAGSLYVLTGLVAASLAVSGLRRGLATGALVLMLPALWLSGSRSAVTGAVAAGTLMLIWGPGRAGVSRLNPRFVLPAAGLLVVVLGGVFVSSSLTSDPTGTASASLGLRSEFTATSARMWASAPAFGVGIGRYYPRSPEFMSARLHGLYAYENAHNYFLQQCAELGLVGGGLFLLMLATLLRGVWTALRQRPDPATLALLTGAAAYLTTCLTGHPLLVPEAAFPFWMALGGAAAAILPEADTAPSWRGWLTRGVAALLACALAVALAGSNRVFPSPPDRGFHDEQRDGDRKYRWTTRHAVAWVQPDIGFLTIDVQAPALSARGRPFIVQLEADGRLVQESVVRAGEWTQVGVALRTRSPRARRRIDLRVNQVWTEKRDRPGPNVTDDRPRGVMAGYPVLHPVDAVSTQPGEHR